MFKKFDLGQAQWLKLIIVATWKADIEKIVVLG
jgi:hypothetical protein